MIISCRLLRISKCIPRLEFLHSYGISRTTNTIHTDIETTNKIATKESGKRILKVAIIGEPNAGKSTLINHMVKRRVFPISKKVHTTRYRARAVCNERNVQLVFLDTPGLVTAAESEKYKLNRDFVSGGEEAIIEADVIGVIHDVSNHFTRSQLDSKVLRLLHLYKNKESCLILNKVDTLKSKRHLLDIVKTLTDGKIGKNNTITYPTEQNTTECPTEKIVNVAISNNRRWENFSHIFMISALLGTGVSDFKAYLLNAAYSNDWLFPEDVFTDQKPAELIQETVRSKLLEYLPQEIPYNLQVDLEYMDLEEKDCIRLVVLIKCDTEKIERLVKGRGGSRIKKIAIEAEQTLSDAFLANVRIRLVICNKQL